MLRYEQIIKDKLEANNVKLLGIQDDRILVEVDNVEHIYRCLEKDNSLIIKNVYGEIEYQIELI